jgi:hypothetical protein
MSTFTKHQKTACGYCKNYILSKQTRGAQAISINKINKVNIKKDHVELGRFVDKSTMETLKNRYGRVEDAFHLKSKDTTAEIFNAFIKGFTRAHKPPPQVSTHEPSEQKRAERLNREVETLRREQAMGKIMQRVESYYYNKPYSPISDKQ